MRIQILSDLHIEFHRDGGAGLLKELDPDSADVLIVAGDLSTQALLDIALMSLCERFRFVVFVAGNHEYYHSSHDDVHQDLARLAAAIPNLHWLHNSTCEVGGVRIGGTTLWFGYDQFNERYARLLSDFEVIRGFRSWVYQSNAAAVRFLAEKAPLLDVVVTHHLPSPRSIDAKFAGSPLNRFYLTDLEETVLRSRAALWIHGHTHASFDYRIGVTRVLCNALGYPHQPNPAFDPRLIVRL